MQTPVVKTCRHHHGWYTLSEKRRKSTIKKHEDIYRYIVYTCIGQFICNNIYIKFYFNSIMTKLMVKKMK